MTDHGYTERYIDRRIREERDFFVRMTAIDSMLRREVFITQLTGTIGRRAAAQEAFSDAARSAVSLSHPNIVVTYDIDTAQGFPFVVQEYVHCESLRSIIDAEKPFHPDDVSALVSQVADAIAYARLRGIPHLALTPDCILVDYDGTVLVNDFGIGSVLANLGTSVNSNAGYRAPEITPQNSGDARSDIYSLGAIAYEMLTGESPHVHHETWAKESGGVHVPADVVEIVRTALDERPQRRYRTIEGFAAELTKCLSPAEPEEEVEEAPTYFRPLDQAPFFPTTDLMFPEVQEEVLVDKGPGKIATVLAWCGLALGILAISWVAFSFLGGDDDSNPDVTRVASDQLLGTSTAVTVALAPDLKGLTVGEAEAETDAAISVSESRTSDTIPPGQIIDQSPASGEAIGSNGISVVISSGPVANLLSGIQVSNVSFTEVSGTLTQLGLNVARQDERSTTIPNGSAIGIVEEEAVAGDTITVRVSMGDRVQIPIDLQSQPLDDVVAQLDELGLTVNEPIAVSRDRIVSAGVDLDDFNIEDNDVVGIQEEDAGFGQWIESGSSVTPVYYDAELP